MVPAERVFDGVAPPSPVTDDQRVVVRERVGLEVRHVVVLRDAPPLMVVRVGVVVGPSDGRVGPAGVSGVAVLGCPVRGGGVGLIAADADRERERQEDGQSQASHPTHGAGPTGESLNAFCRC